MRKNRQWYKFIAVILVLALLIPVWTACGQVETAPVTGGSVPGAEIYIEQEPEGKPVAHCVTNENGEFSFTLSPDTTKKAQLPEKVTLNLYITPPAGKNYQYTTNKVTIVINTAEGLCYDGVLLYNPPTKAAPSGVVNKGGFAVSGRTSE
jgi:hypothetical protein